MRISKGRGMIYSFMIMSPYVFFYWLWTRDSSYSVQLTGLFFFGILLHFLRKIEAGTKAELLFFEQSTGHYWNNGFCLVPSVLPILHNIGIYLLWNLKKEISTAGYIQHNPNIKIDVYRDQNISEHRINSDATLGQTAVYRLSERLGRWIFSLDSKDPELVYQKLGFKIILVALFLGFIGNFFTKNQPGAPSSGSSKNKETVTVFLSLAKENPLPYFPTDEMFAIDYEQNVLHYRNIDNVKLFSYHQVIGKDFPTIVVQEKLCAVVPAGMKIAFLSKIPPVYAVNMKNEVSYVSKPEHISFLRQNTAIFYLLTGSGDKFLVMSDTWKEISDRWEKVDYKIIAEALDKKDIKDGVLGGVVCF